MKGISHSLTMMTAVGALVLSTGAFAHKSLDNGYDPVTGFFVGTGHVMNDTLFPKMNHGTEYLVSDAYHDDVKYMDGIKGGHVVQSTGNMMVDPALYKGDKITNLTTNRSGTITGIKHQGTMDVMGTNGKTVRYQYVTFKVKHK